VVVFVDGVKNICKVGAAFIDGYHLGTAFEEVKSKRSISGGFLYVFQSHDSLHSPVQVPLRSWTIYPREGLFMFPTGVHRFVNPRRRS
jgi:hypothetical protein